MSYVHISNEDSILVLNTDNGKEFKSYTTDDFYGEILALIQEGEYEKVFSYTIGDTVEEFFTQDGVSFNISNGMITIDGYNETVPLNDVLIDKIIKMKNDGFDCGPMINFIKRLYYNTSRTSISELYLFLANNNLPITEDGYFIAYKIVRDDYKDIFSGEIDNSIGEYIKVSRNSVDDNRNNTCSFGLHFCSKGYLPHYGSWRSSGDRCLLVKIDPSDVVSIPSDYGNAKGRTCAYTVIGEVEGDWRDELSDNGYTGKSVVSDDWYDDDLRYDDYAQSEEYVARYKYGYKEGRGSKAKLIFSGFYDINDVHDRGFVDGHTDGRLHRKNKCKDL